jgi:hypothetical protein
MIESENKEAMPGIRLLFWLSFFSGDLWKRRLRGTKIVGEKSHE